MQRSGRAQMADPVAPRATHRRASRVLTGLLVVAGAAILAAGIAVRLADLHFQTVLSNSMQPSISAGDVVVTQGVPTDAVRVGDVIVFQPPNHPEPVIHRVVARRDGAVTTRGDANPVDDPWQVTLAGPKAYRLVVVVPGLGWLSQLQRPVLILAGALVLLAVVLEVGKGVRARARRSLPPYKPRRSESRSSNAT